MIKFYEMAGADTGLAVNVAIRQMNEGDGYDVVIVCCTDDHQATYWSRRLSAGICAMKDGSSASPFPMVFAVSEDWGAGGAGNGLGTLYAYKKAESLAIQCSELI